MVSTSKARQIIYNPNNGTYNPDFSKEPMVLTPELYITGSPTNVIATAETVKWYVRPNTLGQRIPIENNDTYSIGNDFKLTISKNIMKDMLTMEFILEVIYKEPDSDFRTTIPHHMELVNISMGEDGRDGIDGLDGLDGERGLQGPKGENSYTHLAYANNETGTQDFSLSDSNRSYIGMYVDNIEKDSTKPSDYKWTKVEGIPGERGIQGPKGADGRTPYFHIAYATSGDGTEGFSVSDSVGKTYIGQYTDYIENDSTKPSDYSWTLIKGEQGPRGLQGLQGDEGLQGPKGLDSYTHIAYANNSTGTSGFSTSDSINKTYIGMYVDNTKSDSDNPSDYRWTKIKGEDGTDGYTPIKGVDYFDGNDGISIVEVKEYYLVSEKDAGITITGYDWKETIQPISETAPYLWNYERIEYSNGLSDTFGPNIIGRYASDGEKGEDGRGISSITEYYLTSSEDSGVSVEDNEHWSTTFQQTTPTNRYLWNYEEIAYTDGTKDIVGPSIIGTHGMKGDSPIVAYLSNDSHLVPSDADGLNANYENAYTEMYIMDGIEDDTDSYKFSVTESSGIVGKIEGNKYTVTSLSGDIADVKITATKGNFTISKVFTVTKSKQGIKGQSGEDSLIYRLETDSLVLTREVDETLNPGFINIQAVSMKGNDPKKPFTGYFRIYEQHTSTFVTDDFTKLALESGITEEEYIISLQDEPRILRHESIFKESSLKYEPRADAISVYIQLFEDSSFNEVLDSQTVVIVSHGPKGEDAYRVEVLSRNGNTFKNGVVDTWLYAVVYKGEEDITDELDISRFRWERVSEDSASDTLWNQKYFGGTKEIRITTEDVYKRATFTCSITKQ